MSVLACFDIYQTVCPFGRQVLALNKVLLTDNVICCRCPMSISHGLFVLFVCLFIWNTKYSNKVRPAGATRIIINATLDIRRFKRYSEMTIYKRPLKNENTPRLV